MTAQPNEDPARFWPLVGVVVVVSAFMLATIYL